MSRPPFLALACMAGAGLALESALTRYFALAHYSDYGYWVISIAMSGMALSGVLFSLRPKAFLARRDAILGTLPVIAILATGIGVFGAALNPFNALEMQHPALLGGELGHIGLYYLALFPAFFCFGLFASLCFAGFPAQIPKLYAFDLLGAGFGSLLLLGAMYFLPPFALPLLVLLLLVLAGALLGRLWISLGLGLALALIGALWQPARVSEYKALSYALHTADAKVLKSWQSPRGAYALVDDFTERPDIDLSNNAGSMGVQGTPGSYGLYVDGNRLEALPKGSYGDSAWFRAALEAFPYTLKPQSSLLLGTEGGFKAAAVASLGLHALCLESDPDLAREIPLPALLCKQALPFLLAQKESYALIDMSNDYARQNPFALCTETIQAAYADLAPGGILSLGVSLKEEGAWGARLIKTLASLFDPRQVLLYRSAWDLRALVVKGPPSPALLQSLKAFCDERSFDISYAQGLSPAAEVWNELPSLAWDGQAEDAVRDEAGRAFQGRPMEAEASLALSPSSLERPFFFSTLSLAHLDEAWEHLSELPLEELGLPVNLAVLFQALLLALLVLLLPLATRRLAGPGFGRVCVYFSALGLGYFFFELSLIEKFSPFLQDRSLAFSLVLSGMLVFSGLGSLRASSLGWTLAVMAAWCLGAYFFLDRCLLFLAGQAWPLQIILLLLLLAPLAYALGMPFPLGLKALEGRSPGLLPWAWGLNGALSVVAPPLAYLLARSFGYSAVAGAGVLVYFLAWLFSPMGAN